MRPSRRVATKRKVARGHQPGNCDRYSKVTKATAVAAPATPRTRRWIFVPRAIKELGSGSRPPTCDYCQVCPSPLPNSPARALAKVASKLIFNMSVTPVRETNTIGKWRASLWPPDAPLDRLSASLRYARFLRPAYRRDRDPLYLVSFPSELACRRWPQAAPAASYRHRRHERRDRVSSWRADAPAPADRRARLITRSAGGPPSIGWSHPAPRTPPPAPRSP